MKEENEELLGIDKFDEIDPRQHQMKLLFGCGVKFGLRGSGEHTYLEVRNITHGFFPKNHPFSGYKYYGVSDLQDKTHKLSVNTDYVRDTCNNMRVPVMNDDRTSDDLGGSIGRYLVKMAPGQIRIYCKFRPLLSQTLDESTGKRQFFYGEKPIGKNGITKLFKVVRTTPLYGR